MMIGCVIAMDSEAEILLSQTEIETVRTIYGKTLYTGTAFGKDVAICVCGVGKANAAAGACAVISAGADIVLNFGVAGGLNGNTEVTDIYVIYKTVQYDFDLTQINGGKIGTLDGETENFIPLFVPDGADFARRALGTGDRFNDSEADHALLINLGCDVRDMEGGAIAETCKYAGVPLVCIKAISDVYGSGNTAEQYKKNSKLALLNLKASLAEIFQAL